MCVCVCVCVCVCCREDHRIGLFVIQVRWSFSRIFGCIAEGIEG